MFGQDAPLLEIFIRGTLVYLAIFFLFRFAPRREAGSLSMTNLIVIVVIADAAQNAMSGEYHSVTDGLLLVATIIGWSILLDAAAYRWPKVAKIIKPPPRTLVRKGELHKRNLRRELITEDELREQLRERGTDRLSNVDIVLEPNGSLSVHRRDGAERT
jgi:uncharacterized membrane protein YcaP (DUF421 family)